jgi:murein DD-endopeptidase MepM/ murein hydrolase activator NlpD
MARRGGRRGAPWELRFEGARGGRAVVRLGPLRIAAAALLALAALALLAAGLVELPTRLSSSRERRETDVLLARRLQLGERLRQLATRFEQLESDSRRLGERVERVRRLYGLPGLPLAPPAARGAPGLTGSIFAAAALHVAKLDALVEARLSATDSLLATLARWEVEHRDEVVSVPARLPIRAQVAVPTALFGPERNEWSGEVEFHAGLDLAAPAGTAIVAPAGGVVRWAGEAPPSAGGAWWRLGRTVVLAHGDRHRTLFGHCDRVLVRSGQRVTTGQPIATVGSSGRALSPRLHYEVRRRDAADGSWRAIDPLEVVLELEQLERALGAPLPRRAAAGAGEAPPFPLAYAR